MRTYLGHSPFSENWREIKIFRVPDDSYGESGRNFEANKLAPTVSPSSFEDWANFIFKFSNFIFFNFF